MNKVGNIGCKVVGSKFYYGFAGIGVGVQDFGQFVYFIVILVKGNLWVND